MTTTAPLRRHFYAKSTPGEMALLPAGPWPSVVATAKERYRAALVRFDHAKLQLNAAEAAARANEPGGHDRFTDARRALDEERLAAIHAAFNLRDELVAHRDEIVSRRQESIETSRARMAELLAEAHDEVGKIRGDRQVLDSLARIGPRLESLHFHQQKPNAVSRRREGGAGGERALAGSPGSGPLNVPRDLERLFAALVVELDELGASAPA